MSKKTSTPKKKISKKPNTTAIVSASLAAVAAGAAYYSYNKGTWPFAGKKIPGKKIGANANGVSAADNVDVALTNEVAEATVHNPNNDGEFTDDGATGNAD